MTIGTHPAPTPSPLNDIPSRSGSGRGLVRGAEAFFEEVGTRFWRDLAPTSAKVGERDSKDDWKADKLGRNNDTVDPHYGCYIWDELIDFAVNYTYPWGKSFTHDSAVSIALLTLFRCFLGKFDIFDVPATRDAEPVTTSVDFHSE